MHVHVHDTCMCTLQQTNIYMYIHAWHCTCTCTCIYSVMKVTHLSWHTKMYMYMYMLHTHTHARWRRAKGGWQKVYTSLDNFQLKFYNDHKIATETGAKPLSTFNLLHATVCTYTKEKKIKHTFLVRTALIWGFVHFHMKCFMYLRYVYMYTCTYVQ